MKTAIWIEDGRQQVVLTPENDTEKTVLKAISEADLSTSVHWGEFYACQGGWIRESRVVDYGYSRPTQQLNSLIIVVDKKVES